MMVRQRKQRGEATMQDGEAERDRAGGCGDAGGGDDDYQRLRSGRMLGYRRTVADACTSRDWTD